MARTYGVSHQALRLKRALRAAGLGRVPVRTSFRMFNDGGVRCKEYGDAHSGIFRAEQADLKALAASCNGTAWVTNGLAWLSSEHAPGGCVMDLAAEAERAAKLLADLQRRMSEREEWP
jgi:hypothetical protein